jgi:hypothetical protein
VNLRAARAEIRQAFRTPTARQKEAYARYCHTISAAGLIGAATVIFSDSALTVSALLRAASMLVVAVILFLSGTLLNKEQ